MPTYDYRCPNGHDFEHFFRKISDATEELACPVCGAPAVRRVSGGAGLLFKGSGFYLTDYGKNAHRKGGSGGGADASSTSESKSDSSSGGDSAKSSGDASSGAKSDTAKSSAKSDAAKSADSSSSTKSRGGDAK